MYVILLSCVALILQFLPPVASSLGSMTREEGEDVVFMFNTSTKIIEVTWGIREGDTSNFKLGLILVDTSGKVLTSDAGYAGRVSFVGDLSKGQAWFKITNLNINDTNQYTARIILQGVSGFRYSATRLTVMQPAAPVTTIPLQILTRESTTAASSSQNSPRPTALQVLEFCNHSIAINVVKESSEDLSDANSAAYKQFSENFVSEINSVYRNMENFQKAKVTSLSESSIPVKFVVYFKKTLRPNEICAPLKDAVKDNRLGNLKIVPGSLGCSKDPGTSFPTSQSNSACTCTSIIAACVTINIFLILVVVVLLIYIWRLKPNTGRGAGSRRSTSIQNKELDAYENDHPMEDTTEAITTQTTRTQHAEKQLYETINENRDKGTAEIAANVKPTRGPSVGTQGDVPSLTQHYQELQRLAPNPTPLYEPLKQRDLGNKGELTSEVPKTYEQLQQSASGREYQSLTSYKAGADTESKV